ncbi:MAG: hypothetical protein K8R44_09425 [Sulfurimonas sp.]|nr:hypothetical protein [Sulfurimonas sp.]
MHTKLIIFSIIFLISSTISLADKPVWAGKGGQPTQYEKQEHKNAMTSKHEYKKKHKNKKHNSRSEYDGQGMSDQEFIEKKADQTKKNWIGRFFDSF